MNGIHLIARDLKMMWYHKHGRIALVFLLLVPLIYASFFMAGYWNPYGRLDQLPVAVVNLDQGSSMDNKPIHAGNDFVKKLKENKELSFQFVTSGNAAQGLKNGNYYMTLTIPKEFSQKVSSLMSDHPQPAKLIYKINPGKNFVASQISTTATEQMKTKIASAITKSYADGVFSKLQELAKGLSKAGNGADQLNKGTIDAQNGMIRVSDGINQLNSGTDQLKTGSNQLSIGLTKLDQGLEGLKNGSQSLYTGMEQLSNGNTTIEAGLEKLAVGSQSLAEKSQKVADGQASENATVKDLQAKIQEYSLNHPDVQGDQSFQQIVALTEGLSKATDTLKNGDDQLAQGAKQLVNGQTQVSIGMKQFGAKLNEAAGGAKQLADGTTQFNNGFNQWQLGFTALNNGIINLDSGGKQLNNGSGQLVNGLTQLAYGSNVLSKKLNDAAQQTSNIHNNDSLTTMFAEPVQLVEFKISNVPNYGTGITPYFLSLALFVGGIMAANILPLGRRQDLMVNGTVHFINKLGLKYSIGLVQTIIVDLVILFGFKLHVASVPMFLLSSVIVSFTFMTLILMLVTVFGVAGKFMAVTLLVLQLATCGGTFPGELSNPILSDIGQYLPMAHSLQGFQEVISLGDWSQLYKQTFILICYLVFAAGIAWVTSHLQHAKTEANPSM